MAIFIPSRRIWTRQPQYPVQIDWNNPLARGLTAVVLPSIADLDLVSKAVATTFSAAPKKGVGAHGIAVDSTGGAGGSYIVVNDARICTATQTHFVLADWTSATGTYAGMLGAAKGDGSAGSLSLQRNNSPSSTGPLQVFTGASQLTAQFGSMADFVGAPVALGMSGVSGSNGVTVYRNGAIYATGTIASGGVTTQTTARLLTGSERGASTSHYMQGKWFVRFAWDRVLTATEHRELSLNPWQLFVPSNSPIFYSLPSAGGGAHTLSGAVVESTQDSASGTISFVHTLAGAVVESTSDTAAGTISFTHTLDGAAVESSTDVAVGTISFTHTLDGAVVEDGADTAAGTITSAEGTFLSGAVVEDGEDTAAGTISYLHTLDGAAVEDGADTATGTILGTSALSGAVVESTQDSASGGIDNLEAVVPVTQRPAGGGKAGRQKRRRVVIDDELYDVPERDLPALLEAKLANKRPPSTAERIDDASVPEKPRKGTKAAPQASVEPVGVMPSLDEAQARYEAILAELNAQAQADVRQMLERVAVRVLLEIEDEEDSAIALLMQ